MGSTNRSEDLPTLVIINKEATIDLKDLAKALRRIEDEVLEDANGEALRRLTQSRLSYAVEPDTYLRTSPVRCEMPELDLYLQPHRRAFHVEYRWLGVTAMAWVSDLKG